MGLFSSKKSKGEKEAGKVLSEQQKEHKKAASEVRKAKTAQQRVAGNVSLALKLKQHIQNINTRMRNIALRLPEETTEHQKEMGKSIESLAEMKERAEEQLEKIK